MTMWCRDHYELLPDITGGFPEQTQTVMQKYDYVMSWSLRTAAWHIHLHLKLSYVLKSVFCCDNYVLTTVSNYVCKMSTITRLKVYVCITMSSRERYGVSNHRKLDLDCLLNGMLLVIA